MRTPGTAKLLGGLAILAALVATSSWCFSEDKRELPVSLKLPGSITSAVIRGQQLYSVTSSGHLIRVDLERATVEDLGDFQLGLAPHVDVADGKAVVASKDRIYQVDLAGGKVLRSAECKPEAPIRKLGFLGADRVFVQAGARVAVVSLADGKAARTVDLAKITGFVQTGTCGWDSAGRCLFTAVKDGKSEVCVLDVERGEVVDRVAAPGLVLDRFHHGGDIQVVGGRAYVLGLRFGYGVWTASLGYIDLQSRKYHALKLPRHLNRSYSLVAGPDGSVILVGGDGSFLYRADGQLVGAIGPGHTTPLVGVWKGRALTAGPSTLHFVSVSEPVSKK